MFNKLIEEMAFLKEVDAILLGGSRATNTHDKDSDYDVYVYLNSNISEIHRRNVIDKYVNYMEYSNTFWELEDDGILSNGIDIEFIYRDINTIEKSLLNTLEGNVGNGYSTCFIDNFFHSKILYEKDNIITTIRERLNKKSTDLMYSNIIKKNMLLLRDYMPSLFYQIEKAVKRNDIISINHRLSAYFEIMFDVVFALNKKTHPGEKRLLKYLSDLDVKPKNILENITEIFNLVYQDNKGMLATLETITNDLYKLVSECGYDVTMNSYKNAQR